MLSLGTNPVPARAHALAIGFASRAPSPIFVLFAPRVGVVVFLVIVGGPVAASHGAVTEKLGQ